MKRLCALRAHRGKVFAGLRQSSIPFRSFTVSLASHYSLSDQLVNFLPDFDRSRDFRPKNQMPQINDKTDKKDLITEAEAILVRIGLAASCKFLISRLQYSLLIPAFLHDLIPFYEKAPQHHGMGLHDLIYCLFFLNHQELALQVVDEALGTPENVIEEVKLAIILERGNIDVRRIDELLTRLGYKHFPQVLHSDSISLWFKLKLLDVCKHQSSLILKTINREKAMFLNPACVSRLASSLNFNELANYVLRPEPADPVTLCALVKSARNKREFQLVWRGLKSLAKRGDLNSLVFNTLVQKAVSMKLSYTVTSICKYGAGKIRLSLLSKALASVAWAQVYPKESEFNDSSAFFAPDTQYELVRSVMDSVPTPKFDSLISGLLYRLWLSEEAGAPSRILWSYVLALESSNQQRGSLINLSLTRAFLKRPHIEQLRYMALPNVPAHAVAGLLRGLMLNTSKCSTEANLHSSQDIQLLATGIAILSEKSNSKGSQARGNHLLINTISQLFQNSKPSLTSETIKQATRLHTASPRVLMAFIGILVKQKEYVLAVQLLPQLNLERIPIKSMSELLLSVTRDLPLISASLARWLLRSTNVPVPAAVLRSMIIELSTTNALTERQCLSRIEILIKLLLQHKKAPGYKAVISLVDGILRRMQHNGYGSRKRLQWALLLCKKNNVPVPVYERWLAELEDMRAKRKGLWLL